MKYIIGKRIKMILGNCPYCNDGLIQIRDKEVRGKKVKLFACSNAEWNTQDGEMYELKDESSCSFRIWQNTFSRYGKWLSYQEVRKLLEEKSLELEFVSKRYNKKIYYRKNVVLDQQYGASVLWNEE